MNENERSKILRWLTEAEGHVNNVTYSTLPRGLIARAETIERKLIDLIEDIKEGS